MKKKKLQIVVPVMIWVVVAGMLFFKNYDVTSAQSGSSSNFSPVQSDLPNLPKRLQEVDFSLAVTEAIDFESLSKYGIPAIIDYGANSCATCKKMAPVLETLNREMYGKAFIKFADVRQYADVAQNVPIMVIPTQVLVNADGTPFVPSNDLSAQIQFTMKRDKGTGEHIFTLHQGGLTENQMRLILTEMGVGK